MDMEMNDLENLLNEIWINPLFGFLMRLKRDFIDLDYIKSFSNIESFNLDNEIFNYLEKETAKHKMQAVIRAKNQFHNFKKRLTPVNNELNYIEVQKELQYLETLDFEKANFIKDVILSINERLSKKTFNNPISSLFFHENNILKINTQHYRSNWGQTIEDIFGLNYYRNDLQKLKSNYKELINENEKKDTPEGKTKQFLNDVKFGFEDDNIEPLTALTTDSIPENKIKFKGNKRQLGFILTVLLRTGNLDYMILKSSIENDLIYCKGKNIKVKNIENDLSKMQSNANELISFLSNSKPEIEKIGKTFFNAAKQHFPELFELNN